MRRPHFPSGPIRDLFYCRCESTVSLSMRVFWPITTTDRHVARNKIGLQLVQDLHRWRYHEPPSISDKSSAYRSSEREKARRLICPGTPESSHDKGDTEDRNHFGRYSGRKHRVSFSCRTYSAVLPHMRRTRHCQIFSKVVGVTSRDGQFGNDYHTRLGAELSGYKAVARR